MWEIVTMDEVTKRMCNNSFIHEIISGTVIHSKISLLSNKTVMKYIQ